MFFAGTTRARKEPARESTGTYPRYHAEVEFQSVEVPGEKEPFLAPKLVTATLETNKGKIVIASVYEPKARTK